MVSRIRAGAICIIILAAVTPSSGFRLRVRDGTTRHNGWDLQITRKFPDGGTMTHWLQGSDQTSLMIQNWSGFYRANGTLEWREGILAHFPFHARRETYVADPQTSISFEFSLKVNWVPAKDVPGSYHPVIQTMTPLEVQGINDITGQATTDYTVKRQPQLNGNNGMSYYELDSPTNHVVLFGVHRALEIPSLNQTLAAWRDMHKSDDASDPSAVFLRDPRPFTVTLTDQSKGHVEQRTLRRIGVNMVRFSCDTKGQHAKGWLTEYYLNDFGPKKLEVVTKAELRWTSCKKLAMVTGEAFEVTSVSLKILENEKPLHDLELTHWSINQDQLESVRLTSGRTPTSSITLTEASQDSDRKPSRTSQLQQGGGQVTTAASISGTPSGSGGSR